MIFNSFTIQSATDNMLEKPSIRFGNNDMIKSYCKDINLKENARKDEMEMCGMRRPRID